MIGLALSLVWSGPRWSACLGGDLMFNQIPVGRRSLGALAPFFRGSSVALANLEAPLARGGRPTAAKSAAELYARTQFILRADPAHVEDIARAGIDAVSLGNNHAMDYGAAGLDQMLTSLDRAGIKHAGAGRNQALAAAVTVLRLRSGLRIGLIGALAFAGAGARAHCTPAGPARAGVNGLELGGAPTAAKLAAWVGAAHRRCDVLVAAVHGGIEGQAFPTAYQVRLAHALVDAGVDVVWGHHPHVLEGAELYRGKPILYSMGNLVSATPAVSGLVRLRFSGAAFAGASFQPIRISGGIATPSPRGRAAFLSLCRATARRLRGVPLPFDSN